jgi:hypothetical protein
MAGGLQDAPPHAGQVVRRVLLRRNIAIDAETAQLVADAVRAALRTAAPSRPLRRRRRVPSAGCAPVLIRQARAAWRRLQGRPCTRRSRRVLPAPAAGRSTFPHRTVPRTTYMRRHCRRSAIPVTALLDACWGVGKRDTWFRSLARMDTNGLAAGYALMRGA